tara:strand:+ start:22 stop:669 length:648 start_codon:yes stop_codon:yes gene_type:complete
MISDSTETILVFEKEENQKKNDIIEWLKAEIKLTKNKTNKWHLQDRLSKLAGGVATIKLAGNSEVELKEKKDRVDDSIHATKAALEEGIVAGGGIALMRCAQKKFRKKPPRVSSASFLKGYSIVYDSLQDVFKKIVENSGEEPDSIYGICAKAKDRYGYDVKNKKFGDMYKMGIIDPFKVTKNAVLNAASVAGIILTTSCVISNKRVKKEDIIKN